MPSALVDRNGEQMNTTAWRWFPLGLIAVMGFVFAVNGYMVYSALSSFPGIAGTDGFDLSNGYARVLQAAAQQSALGWRIESGLDETRHPLLHLTDQTGTPLRPDALEAHAERPVGPAETTVLNFQPLGQGRFQSEQTLFSGQWDVMVTVHAGGQTDSTTRRVIVR
jgi:nitrogen fixation protein FixH